MHGGMAAVRPVGIGETLAGEVITSPVALIASEAGASLDSLAGAALLAEVVIGDGIDLSRCRFDGAVGLHHLRFTGRPWAPTRRLTLDGAGPAELRALRAAARSSGQPRLARELHLAELDATRRASHGPARIAWEAYRFVGGYGEQPSRPFAVWLVLCSIATALIYNRPEEFVGGDFTYGFQRIDIESWHSVLFKVVMRSSVAVFSELDAAGMHTDGYALLLILKLATTLLAVLFAVGLASRLRH